MADRVLPFTRLVAVVVIPFLHTAFVMLHFFPRQTDRSFVWHLRPSMTAMMLGATCAGGSASSPACC